MEKENETGNTIEMLIEYSDITGGNIKLSSRKFKSQAQNKRQMTKHRTKRLKSRADITNGSQNLSKENLYQDIY